MGDFFSFVCKVGMKLKTQPSFLSYYAVYQSETASSMRKKKWDLLLFCFFQDLIGPLRSFHVGDRLLWGSIETCLANGQPCCPAFSSLLMCTLM